MLESATLDASFWGLDVALTRLLHQQLDQLEQKRWARFAALQYKDYSESRVILCAGRQLSKGTLTEDTVPVCSSADSAAAGLDSQHRPNRAPIVAQVEGRK